MRRWTGLCGMVCVGCASTATVETLGEAGLLVYRTTVMHGGQAPAGWSDAHFALGETYAVSVDLTELGAASLSAPDAVVHRLQASSDYASTAQGDGQAGLVVHHPPIDSRDVPDLDLTPAEVGALWLEARVDGATVDVVKLQVVAGRVEVSDGVVYGPEDGRW